MPYEISCAMLSMHKGLRAMMTETLEHVKVVATEATWASTAGGRAPPRFLYTVQI